MFHLSAIPVDACARSLLSHSAQTATARQGGVLKPTKARLRPQNFMYGQADQIVKQVTSNLILANSLPRAEPVPLRGPLSKGYNLAIGLVEIIQWGSGSISFSMKPRGSPDHMTSTITRCQASQGDKSEKWAQWPWTGSCDGVDVANVQIFYDGRVIILTTEGPVIIEGDDAVWDVALSRRIHPSCL